MFGGTVMEDLSRNTDEVIMQIHNVFRYADPVFRLTTIGAVKLIQFLARMAKEKQISQVEIEDFGKFLKATAIQAKRKQLRILTISLHSFRPTSRRNSTNSTPT